MYEVVKPFAYGANGIHGVELVIGDVCENFGDCTAGLLAEGYIAPVVAKSVVAVETVAEREVAVDLLPIETAEEAVVTVDEDTAEPFEMAAEPDAPPPRRGRKRK